MRKIEIYIITILVLVLSGCSQSFLNTQDLTQKTDATFYLTPDDAAQALTGIYSSLPNAMSPNLGIDIFIASEQMSDECYGGGGQIDHEGAIDQFQETDINEGDNAWKYYYQGIFRANTLIKKFSQITGWSSDDVKNQTLGEAYFLRAYYYFDLMKMFGGPVNGKMTGVPLITDPSAPTSKRADVDSVYAQIASDLKEAITIMPASNFTSLVGSGSGTNGHATKWAAEALMARVFLFYNGEAYGRDCSQLGSNATMPLVGGGKVTNTEVVGWIDDCVTNSGYKLASDFRNLWPYSYSNEDYGYAKNNHLKWVTEDVGANTEAIFDINYSNLNTNNYYNMNDLYLGWRMQTQMPFGYGWGFCTVSAYATWNSWDNADLRKAGSICDVNNPDEGISGYTWHGDLMNETGYWQKKYLPVNVKSPVDGHLLNYSCILYGTPENIMTDNTQSMMLIRFADVLLMGAELGSSHAQQYLDMVRSRAGLPSIPVTLANIQQERKHELAFEGIRYWDEIRWGTLEADLKTASGEPMWNAGVSSTYTPNLTRLSKTKGFLPIPTSQITLSNGKLQQNDGWNDADADRMYTTN
ncbi:RagB/SusD family nutrient uptake outer membrane protein [Microbacter margulisiae]|uniref:RagB/SusD family nutrient uptake outer membrane protein n=1 Tax=Microbacter margulisiae TaxID=1350067 RepID=A0A7W5DT07_9PORP|nr:RagB/SusD family nutrient uptake outer membrane protein [Microbacter margulisiae]MBB3188531.1 hypothetical protein [Microbacter margulisiae]